MPRKEMRSNMHSIESIREKIAPIARNYGIKRVYLFGSYAKDTANEDSDVDLLVEKGTPLSLLALSCLLQDTKDALDLSVDLITTDGIEESFKSEISDTEVLIYEA